MTVTGNDIINSAKNLLKAPYRFWYPGSPLPMWFYDGQGSPPPAGYLVNGPGVMCSDLISYSMLYAGVDPSLVAYGTEAMGNGWLIDQTPFDPSTPGEPGAVALAPYAASDISRQGHIALFLEDGETLIQALTFNGSIRPGVTSDYDQNTTYNWGGDTAFTVYGHLPGVTYDTAPQPPESLWQKYGWYEAVNARYDLEWHPAER